MHIDPIILNFVLEWWPSWIQNLHIKPKYSKVESDKQHIHTMYQQVSLNTTDDLTSK